MGIKLPIGDFELGIGGLGLGIGDLNPKSLIQKITIPNWKSPIGDFHF